MNDNNTWIYIICYLIIMQGKDTEYKGFEDLKTATKYYKEKYLNNE